MDQADVGSTPTPRANKGNIMTIGGDIYNADIDTLRKMLVKASLDLGSANLRIAALENGIEQHRNSSKWDPVIGNTHREDGMSVNGVLWKLLNK